MAVEDVAVRVVHVKEVGSVVIFIEHSGYRCLGEMANLLRKKGRVSRWRLQLRKSNGEITYSTVTTTLQCSPCLCYRVVNGIICESPPGARRVSNEP